MTQGATDAAEAEDVPPMFPLGSSDRPGDENGPLSGPSLSGRSARGGACCRGDHDRDREEVVA
jgi:hypothetical protein